MTVSERHLPKLARTMYNDFVSVYNRALQSGINADGAVAAKRDLRASRYVLVFPDAVASADTSGELARIQVEDIVTIRHERPAEPHAHFAGGLEPTFLRVTGADGTTIEFEGHWSHGLHVKLLLENPDLRRDEETAHSARVMRLVQQDRDLWTKDRRSAEQRRRSAMRPVIGLSALAVTVGVVYAVASSSSSQSPTSSETPSTLIGAGADTGSSDRVDGSGLQYPGDADLFERGLNIAVPWTAEISQHILVNSAQQICASLDRSGDPVQARDLAIEFGFEFQDTAPFVEDSVAHFCPQFKPLVPQMSNG